MGSGGKTKILRLRPRRPETDRIKTTRAQAQDDSMRTGNIAPGLTPAKRLK